MAWYTKAPYYGVSSIVGSVPFTHTITRGVNTMAKQDIQSTSTIAITTFIEKDKQNTYQVETGRAILQEIKPANGRTEYAVVVSSVDSEKGFRFHTLDFLAASVLFDAIQHGTYDFETIDV